MFGNTFSTGENGKLLDYFPSTLYDIAIYRIYGPYIKRLHRQNIRYYFHFTVSISVRNHSYS